MNNGFGRRLRASVIGQRRCAKLLTELTTGKYFAWNPGCEPCVLLEEYIDGDEFDVDVLLWDGKCVYVNVIDNWPTVGLGFLETGSNCPTVYPDHKADQVWHGVDLASPRGCVRLSDPQPAAEGVCDCVCQGAGVRVGPVPR